VRSARDIWSEKIVFRGAITTALPANGVTVQQLTSGQETWNAIAQRQGGAEYQLVLDGATVATGGLMFHYNVPYADISMETVEPFRRHATPTPNILTSRRTAQTATVWGIKKPYSVMTSRNDSSR
jgi:hypothetical protein